MKVGAKHSLETREKMSYAQKGEKHHKYWLGKKRSPEHLAKMILGIKKKAKGKPFCETGCGVQLSNYNSITRLNKMCRNCRNLNHKGEKCYNYIKDRSKLVKKQERNDPAYKEWRMSVWLRDNFKCKIANPDCKGKIEAHHILGWSEFVELRYEINNGITLCHAHHPRKRAEEKRLSPYFQNLVSVSKI